MKKSILIIMTIVITFFLSGCLNKSKKEDLVSKYNEYWQYSLGNYNVKSKKVDDNGGSSGGLVTNKWNQYTFTFNDSEGNQKEIKINDDFDDFNEELSLTAEHILNDKIRQAFDDNNLKTTIVIPDSIYSNVERIDSNINLYDSEHGLKFKELNLNNLKENNIKVTFTTLVYINGSLEDNPNLKQELIDNTNFIFENYQYQNISFEFNIKPENSFYSTFYKLEYDGNNYSWSEKSYN